MVRNGIYEKRIKQESLGKTPFHFRQASAAVMEEEEAEEEIRDAEDRFDIRDLLLDDAD
jgi:hypothetical protein